jgi:hypothetical protein
MDNNERVSIQYSIGIHELPDEVERLLKKAQQQLEGVTCTDIPALLEVERDHLLSLNTLTDVAVVRKKLGMVDDVLRDMENIINGFVSYRVQEFAPPDLVPEDHPDALREELPSTLAEVDPHAVMPTPTHHPGMPTPPMGLGAPGPDMKEIMKSLKGIDLADLHNKFESFKEAQKSGAPPPERDPENT